PVRTFDTACTYFHKFRLNFRDAEYNYQDAALASLFVACKVEDTIKKSRDILVAAYMVKNPDKTVPPEDKFFDASGKIIIGLERLILETVGFDFRTRYPQKLLVKVVRRVLGKSSANSYDFFATAYAMCIDLYKTFVPIKRTTFSMVMAVVELTARMRGEHVERVREFAASRFSSSSRPGTQQQQQASTSRDAVMETMLDLLDLYVQHHKATRIGALFDLGTFIDIKIRLNTELDSTAKPRYLHHCHRCEVEDAHPLSSTTASATDPAMRSSSPWPADASIRRTARGQDGTMRFVFDPEVANGEQDTVSRFFRDEYEEYEVEMEEPVPTPDGDGDAAGGGRGRGGGGGGVYRGGYRDRGDHQHRRGAAPYGSYRGDRHRGRGRFPGPE
ncbi:hypothetical protein E4U42_000143, partial [Claviceps africana]